MSEPPDRHEIVRRANQRAVLDAVLTGGPISRRGITSITRLSKPVVLGVVTELARAGLIHSEGTESGRAGRSPQLYTANPRAGLVVGIDLGGTKVRAAVADLDGVVLTEVVEPTHTGTGTVVADQIVRLVRTLAGSAGVRNDDVTVIVIGSPGVADPDGRMQLALNVAGLDEFSLMQHVRRRLHGVTVVVENDVNLAAIGERAEGSGAGCHHLAVISIGTGIGAGLIIGGRLTRGRHGAAGEIAWLTIHGDPTRRDARRRGALELAAGARGIHQALLAMRGDHPASPLTSRSTAADVFAAAARGDALATAVVAAEADLVARAVLSVVSVVDPEVVVLAGGIGANPDLLPLVQQRLERMAPMPIKVETSKLGERSGITGALALARSLARSELFGVETELYG